MTFLTLCADVQRECDIVGTSITSVTGNTTELNRVVNWVRQAWNDIQNRHTNWRWMRSTFSVNTTAGDDSYAPTDCTDTRLSATISRFSHWIPLDDKGSSNVKVYLTSAGVSGERWMSYLQWPYFRSLYRIGNQTNNLPFHYTIDPQNNLVLGPKPNDIYTVSGEYQMSAQTLTASDDVPEMPTQFHDLIVYMAMRKYAGFESAPDVMSRAITEGNRVMRQLEANQLPEVQLAGPLA